MIEKRREKASVIIFLKTF